MKRIRSLLHRLAADRDGAVAVEFGLIAPLVFILLVGVIDLGRAFYDEMALLTAARGAVQYARQYPADVAKITRVALDGGGLPSSATVDTPQQFCECPDSGRIACGSQCPSGVPFNVYVSVTVRQDFQTLAPYPGLPSPLPLAGTAVMRVR